MKIACIGECMVELSNRDDKSLAYSFAGDSANLAVYLSRLLPGARVSYVTAVGEDEISDAMLAGWRRENIHTDLVRRICDCLPGIYWIRTNEDGERRFHYWRSNSAAKRLLAGVAAEELGEKLSGFDYVCLSGISLAILKSGHRERLMAVLRGLSDSGSQIVFDSNFRGPLWSSLDEARVAYSSLLSMTNIALVSFEDEHALFGDKSADETWARLESLGIPEIVVRQGAAPCLIRWSGRTETVPPEIAEHVRDTSGAGDAFDAAYLAARCQGQPPVPAATAGHALAAQVVSRPGAIIDRSDTPDLKTLLD